MIVTVPVISLWRPWADWVVLGWKKIETRRHSKFRGLAGSLIAIHAAQKWDKSALALARDYLTTDQLVETARLFDRRERNGAIIGCAVVTEHRELSPDDAFDALIECETIRCGLILTSPKIFARPISTPGRQGIWHANIPMEVPCVGLKC